MVVLVIIELFIKLDKSKITCIITPRSLYMPWKTSTVYEHTLKVKGMSFEVLKRVNAILAKCNADADFNINDDGIEYIHIISNLNPVPQKILDLIEDRLPSLIAMEEAESTVQEDLDFAATKVWVETFKMPKVPHKSNLCEFYSVIASECVEVKAEFKKNKTPASARISDIEDLISLLKLFDKSRIREARKAYKSLDTAVRELVPDKLRDFLNGY
jgi:hypothetical protein